MHHLGLVSRTAFPLLNLENRSFTLGIGYLSNFAMGLSDTKIATDADTIPVMLENCNKWCRPLRYLHLLKYSLILEALQLLVHFVSKCIRDGPCLMELWCCLRVYIDLGPEPLEGAQTLLEHPWVSGQHHLQ